MSPSDLTSSILVDLLAGAVSFALGYFSHNAVKRIRGKRMHRSLELHALRHQPTFSALWIRHYYLDHGALDDLYLAGFKEGRSYLGILTKPSWHSGPLDESRLLQCDGELESSSVAVHERVLKRRRQFLALESSSGQLWNDDIVCARAIRTIDGSPPIIEVGKATYFQYLSACGALEDETISAAASRHGGSTAIRDRALGSTDRAAQCLLGANGLGMQVTVAFPLNGEINTLIQQRSMSVATYAGALGVVPIFGCQPFAIDASATPSLYHNFLREYLEELFDVTEVERPKGHLDDRWFYGERPVRWLRERAGAGTFKFEILGIGVDALNGEVNVAALALIADESFDVEYSKMKRNWEASHITARPLFSSAIRQDILSDRFQPGSAFSLCLSLRRLERWRAGLNEDFFGGGA